ncbi:hypothetical protein G6F37_011987 [Rhizopus arrhizus]|nr:hypothetical protein G6F38_012015 [Rhizopus arrhizus]KAG1146336.1 hypothetical protein G6F37_011987 [Rhizopus arrhizus]
MEADLRIEDVQAGRVNSDGQPIIVEIDEIVCINSTTADVIDMEINQNLKFPFAMQLPCPGWAKSFHLFNGGSIHAYLKTQRLHPLVAVAHFLIEQKLSLIAMEHKEDPTIQQLFALAKDIFGNDIQEYENLSVVLQQVCNQARSQFSKANKRLLEDVEDPEARKRTARCLDDGILYVNEICRKNHIAIKPLTTSLESSSEASTSSSTPSQDLLPASEHENPDWAFIDSARKHMKNKMDWETCFQIGKDIGLFTKYSTPKSAKSAYFCAKSGNK